MPRIRYQVAASLDGFIAGPNGEVDWIIIDPDMDFKALFAQYDTFLMGRGTYEASLKMGQRMPGNRTIVFSGTLQQDDHPDVTIIREPTADTIAKIRAEAEKDIWLFGGGVLFRSFLDAAFVDTVEVAVIPVLLGEGIPLLPPTETRVELRLTGQTVYEKTGIVMLEYEVK